MRTLVTLLAAALVLASCEPPSAEPTTTPDPVADPGTDFLRQLLEPDGNATFDPSWGAPTCATVGSRCDSGTLLEAVLEPEPHAPNTVGGSCEDGAGGIHGYSPMLQRLAVYRSDGTALAAGKEVTIEAKVVATSTFWQEYLNLYVATDASNPTWTLIATLMPSSSGTRVLRTTYLLPASGTLVLRGQSSSTYASDSACLPDAYDHDDLVFAVGADPDTTPPSVVITSPAQGATLQNLVKVDVRASDDFGVQRVELYDGSTRVSSSTLYPYSLYWGSRTAPNGPHTLTVRAYDAAGNSTSASVHFLLDNDFVPPQLSLVTPGEGATVNQTISLSGFASDDRGVVRVVFEMMGDCSANACPIHYMETTSPPPIEQFQVEWNTRGVANGRRVLSARAYDEGGNASPTVKLNVIVDNDYSPPVTTLTAPVSGAVLSGQVSLEASASDDRQLSGVSFYVDDELIGTDTTAPYSLSWDSASVFTGSHTLYSLASDGRGNQTRSAPVTVETNNPGSVHYDPVLKVPRCDLVQASCDSRALLQGRATLGPERNTPNTLDGCVDGTSGTYRYSQSIERLRVIREDGTAMATGKQVRLEADVWVSSAQDDSLALYYAADATQPSWTYLTTLKAPTGTRDHSLATLSVRYVLPAGSSQAVRAILYSGTSAGACTTTGSVDRDDLVFAVGQELDTLPPEVAILSPTSGATVAGTVTVSVSASDDFGVAAVDLYEGTTRLATSTLAPFSLSWNSRSGPNGSHTLTVRARDLAGHEVSSQPVTVTVDNDFNVPAVALTSPAPDSQFTGETVVLSAEATDDRGVISRVEFYDGTRLLGSDSSAPFTYSWALGYLSYSSTRTLSARAYDAAGNVGTSAPVVVHLSPEFTPPSVSITAPQNGASLVGTVTIWANASDASGLSGVKVFLDGTLLGLYSYSNGFSWNTLTAANGSHTLSVLATDTYGNTATSTVSVTVDNAAPAVAITSPASGATVGGVVPLQADATDNLGVARVDFFVDGALLASDTAAPFGVNWDSGSWANGNHTLSAKAYDAANNMAASTGVVVTTYQPGSAVYDASVRVPSCATLNNVCDTTTLVRGRYFDESYFPSTISRSCDDGAASYWERNRERINRIKLSSADGAVFASGRRARIEVHVTAFDTASDALDLFYASEAYSPSWTYLTTLRPGATGDQVLSTEYVLPAGFRQAVRAQFRAGGDSNSACSPGDFNDRDDLVFAVDGDPTVVLTAPSSNAQVRGPVSLTATATDDQPVARVEFHVDGTLIGTDTTSPHGVSWDSTTVADGVRSLTAKAYDSGGRVGTSTPVVVNVDNTPPDVALTSPAQGMFLRSNVLLEATASDPGGVAKVEFYAGTTLLGTATVAPYAVSWDTATGANGAITLTTKAYDLAGNVTVSAGRTVSVDNAAPTVAITSPANGATLSSLSLSTTIQASASDNVGVTQVVFYDGGAVMGTDTTAPYSVSWNLLSAAKGTHTLTAKAYDAAGNVTISAPISVKVN